LIARGISSNEIDRQIKVNDFPAFQAIEHLSLHAVEHHDEYAMETSKRLNNALNFINWGLLLLPLVLLSGIFMLVLLRKVREVNISLNENRQFLSDMFEAASDAILIVDKSGIISEANKQAIELFGLPENKLKGKSVESLMPKRFRDQHSSLRMGAFTEAKSRELSHALQFYALGKDDKEIPIEISLSYTMRNEEKYAMVSLRDITERKKSEEILHRNEIMLRRAQHVSGIGSWDWDIKSNTLVWSDEIFPIFGEEPGSKNVSYDNFLAHIHPEDKGNVVNAINSALVYDQPYNIEHRIVRPDGTQRLVYEQGDVFRDEKGEAVNMVGVVRDITEQKQNEIKLSLADNVFNCASESIIVTDTDERILRVNSAFTTVTGYSSKEAIGRTPGELLKSGKHDEEFYKSMWEELNINGNWVGDICDRHKDGSNFLTRHNISAVKDHQGNVIQYISIFLDITKQKRAEERIKFLAQYDQLTKLPNRALFNDRLQHSIDRAQRSKNKIGLMFIDLDGFKNVNDTLGHQAGDELLQIIAERISNLMRVEDTVARFGGDEFTIIMEELNHSDGAIVVAKNVLQTIGEVIYLSGQEVSVGASIGISIYPDNGEDANSIINNSDTAMYQAKKQGKNCFKFYVNDHL
jgi:diguanylate cyclase (GGDEF)-like protein/PAS domain S-box-containing protein